MSETIDVVTKLTYEADGIDELIDGLTIIKNGLKEIEAVVQRLNNLGLNIKVTISNPSNEQQTSQSDTPPSE